METINRRIVAAYIVSSDNKLLLGRKDPAKGGVYLEFWHTPGGGVDGGESDDEAIIREVREETGLDIRNAYKVLVDDKGVGESVKKLAHAGETLVKMQFNIFKVELEVPASEIIVQELDDLIGFQWFDVNQLDDSVMNPPSNALIARIGDKWLREKLPR